MARARGKDLLGKDLLGRIADVGEEAISRIADAPGADRLAGAMNAMRDRMDDMSKRLRGLEDLEKRLAALEKKVERLSKPSPSSTRSTTAKKTTSTKSSGATARRTTSSATKKS